MGRDIEVVEPQMDGVFHAPFNAALLHATLLAHPDCGVSFSGFPRHVEAVKAVLDHHAPEVGRHIDWCTLDPPSSPSVIARLRHGRQLFRRVLKIGNRVLFTSISRMQLLLLKREMRGRDQVRAVLHGDLEGIERSVKRWSPAALFSLRRVLLGRHPPGLRYLLLGESIRAHIPSEFREMLSHTGVIDHPYHFPAPTEYRPTALIFGIFGNTGNGRDLEWVARRVRQVNAGIAFRLVGFLESAAVAERLRDVVECATHIPIPRATFIERAQTLSHALWLAPIGAFRLRASAAFFDSLYYVKPLIYTANPFIDSYLTETRGIGTRCGSLDAVADAVLAVSAALTPQSYAQSQAAIIAFRTRFTPQALAPRLLSALAWH